MQVKSSWTPTAPTCTISPLSTRLTPTLHASETNGSHVKLAPNPGVEALALAAAVSKAPAVKFAVISVPDARNSYDDESTCAVSPTSGLLHRGGGTESAKE